MIEFTKGPWIIRDQRYIDSVNRGKKFQAIGQVGSNGVRLSKIDIANAHLIASAPDMYEALKEVLRISRESNSVELIEYTPEIAHILAKAKGE